MERARASARTILSGSAFEIAEKQLQRLFLEVIRDCFEGKVDAGTVASFFVQVHQEATGGKSDVDHDSGSLMVGASSSRDKLLVPNILVDIIWQLDIELTLDDGDSNSGKQTPSRVSADRAKFIELLRQIVSQNFIPSILMKERLEAELLENIGLIQAHKAFTKKSIRLNTALLYKQQKFNLLREESEGFSMLATYLASSLPPPLDHYWQKFKGKMSLAEIEEVRKVELKKRVMLVLDVVLDVFLANVTDHWDFFIDLLNSSHWRGKDIKKVVKRDDKDVEITEREAGSVCGQILGFKFGYYNTVANPGVTSPSQLFWIAALLIRHKLVKLDDLYPHLYPPDEDIDAEYEAYMRKLSEQQKDAGRYNDSKLAEAGALGDDFTAMIKERGSAEQLSQPEKIESEGLLAYHLLAVGDLTHGKIILDRLPKLSSMYTEIIHVVIEPVYKEFRPTLKFKVREPPPLTKLCPIFERPLYGKKYAAPRYKFFYEVGKKSPACVDLDGAQRILRALLPYIGANLSRDPILLTKICRIGKEHVSNAGDDDKVKNGWLTIIAQYLFPALALSDQNPGLGKRDLAIIARAGCIRDAKYIMRRLSKETTKQYGRHIGKLVHSNPAIAFTNILEQIQAYDNQITFVVDATRYLTELSFDVLNFCLIEALAENKERLQPGGTGIRLWLKALSTFAGNLFRKHSVELQGLLRFIFCQLVKNNIQDLTVIQELIAQMSGVKPIDESTDAQLEALAGGECLRREALFFDNARFTRKPSARLAKAFIETQLAIPFLVILGQHRKECVFREEFNEIKILGWLQDNVQTSLLQVSDFFATSSERDSFSKLVPSIVDLCGAYRLDPEVAFHIFRPKFMLLLKKVEDANPKTSSQFNGATIMHDSSKIDGDSRASMDIDEPNGLAVEKADIARKPSRLEGLIGSIDSILPEKVWTVLPQSFYLVFWQLSLYDIYIPRSRYQSEILKQRSLMDAMDAERPEPGVSQAKKKKDRDRCLTMMQQLEKELKTQEESCRMTHERLAEEKSAWFDPVYRNEIIELFMQYCFDAIYCAKFVLKIHSLGTENFSTIALYDKYSEFILFLYGVGGEKLWHISN
ncbi:transcription factor/nuclear export subunit protein 2-domain-containing protein [Chytridium lagenaria]|nr:transcription factor/nuclear export subunit protein 2-domain-containing protein [Chytridium lagenaria]